MYIKINIDIKIKIIAILLCYNYIIIILYYKQGSDHNLRTMHIILFKPALALINMS